MHRASHKADLFKQRDCSPLFTNAFRTSISRPGGKVVTVGPTESCKDFGLPMRVRFAIADERGRFAFVPQVLAPSFPFFGCLATALVVTNEGLPEAVRIGGGQASPREGAAEYPPDRLRGCPHVAPQSLPLKLAFRVRRNRR